MRPLAPERLDLLFEQTGRRQRRREQLGQPRPLEQRAGRRQAVEERAAAARGDPGALRNSSSAVSAVSTGKLSKKEKEKIARDQAAFPGFLRREQVPVLLYCLCKFTSINFVLFDVVLYL